MCFRIAYRPVLGIQWVVWAVECDGDTGDFFLACLYGRVVATMADHTLKTVLLAIRQCFDLLTVSQELLTWLVLWDDSCEFVA